MNTNAQVYFEFPRNLSAFPGFCPRTLFQSRTLCPCLCNLCGYLHVQIMFVLCFAKQMIYKCLSPHTHTQTYMCTSCGGTSRTRSMQAWGARFFGTDSSSLGVLRESRTDNRSRGFFQLSGTWLVMMWSTWLYSVWSVILSVGAICIIAIIHRRHKRQQVLSPIQPLFE